MIRAANKTLGWPDLGMPGYVSGSEAADKMMLRQDFPAAMS